MVFKAEKSVAAFEKVESKTNMVTVSETDLKDLLLAMKKLSIKNAEMHKEIAFLKKDGPHKNSILRVLEL